MPIDPGLLAEVKKLKLRLSHASREGLMGDYQSKFKGRGLEFDRNRPYTLGDDTRFIDWKVTARSQDTWVKEFKEERELRVLVAIDSSHSMIGSGQGIDLKPQLKKRNSKNASFHGVARGPNYKASISQDSKWFAAAKIASLISLIAHNNGDKLGYLRFSSKLETYRPPNRPLSSIWSLIAEICDLDLPGKANQGTSFKALSEILGSRLKRRTLVFVISDFIFPEVKTPAQIGEHLKGSLGAIAGIHDIVPVVITEPSDMRLPKLGLVDFICPETGQSRTLDTNSSKVRDEFKAQSKAYFESLQSAFLELGIHSIPIEIHEDPLPALKKHLESGSYRRSLAA